MEETNIRNSVTASNEVTPLIDIFYRTLHYWPWILISVFACVSIAFIYLLYTPKVYEQHASLLIKDDGKGKSAGGYDDFGDFGFLTNNTNIQNEIATLKSTDFMEEVVRRLNLDMNYLLDARFHDVVAYGTTLPVTAHFIDIPDKSAASFELNVSPNGKVKISGFKYKMFEEELEDDKIISGNIGDTIATIAGPIVIKPTSFYSKGEPIELTVTKAPLKSTVDSYESRLSVNMNNEKSTVIDLSFKDQNIERADEVLSTIIGVYNEMWIRDKNQVAISTSNFINERLKVIEHELGNVDSDISSYKSANLVPDIDAAASSYMAQSQALSNELLGINNQLQMTRYIRNYLTSDNDNEKVLPSNTGIDNNELEAQINAYNQKLFERNNLRSKSSEKNPLVSNLNKELSDMREAIVGSVDNSITNLQTQMKGISGARGQATSKLASNPTQAKYLLSAERQQKVKESLYLFLLQKREDNELNQAFTAYNSRVIENPGGSDIPVAPKKRIILMAAFLIGLVIPFGVVYVKETFNTKLRGRKDLEGIKTPMLGEIPQLFNPDNKKGENASKTEISVKQKSRDIINEAFRVLRTNVDFARVNKDGCNVLVLTSFNPGSGKSFISVNLAAAISLKGKRVLVIDGDMRHGSASGYVGKKKDGLSSYLSGESDDIKSMLVTPADFPNMQVLPIGKVPPNPTELLESDRLGKLIESQRPDYDYIIIDCPPIEVVADAQIIDQYADRTIFVLRAGVLERTMISVLENLYEQKKYTRMACILNGTRNDRGRYGYSHSYKYGYGYGYGYGYNYDSEGSKKKKKNLIPANLIKQIKTKLKLK